MIYYELWQRYYLDYTQFKFEYSVLKHSARESKLLIEGNKLYLEASGNVTTRQRFAKVQQVGIIEFYSI